MDKEARKYKKGLEELSTSCFIFLRQLDHVMSQKESGNRGRLIAQLSNQLEIANDRVRHFLLDKGISGQEKEEEWARIKEAQ